MPATSPHLPLDIIGLGSCALLLYATLSATFFVLLVRYLTGHLATTFGPLLMSAVVLTCASLPVGVACIDLFLVGNMKNSSGHYQQWAADGELRKKVSTTVAYAYYACCTVNVLNIFVTIPLAYFTHKEKSLAAASNRTPDLSMVLAPTGVCFGVLFLLLTIGYFVPVRKTPASLSSLHTKLPNVIVDGHTTECEKAFSFALNGVRIIGISLIATYTALGMTAGPIEKLRNRSDPRSNGAGITAQRSMITLMVGRVQHVRISPSGGSEITGPKEIRKSSRHHNGQNWRIGLRNLSRPFRIAVGLSGLLIGSLIFASLLVANIVRAVSSMGEQFGYLVVSAGMPNPLDRFLAWVAVQSRFPADILFVMVIVGFFILAAVDGYRRIHIRIPWFKSYPVVAWKTPIRSLLAVTMNLAIVLTTFDVFLLYLVPQYMSYSSQKYVACTLDDSTIRTPLPDRQAATRTIDSDAEECRGMVENCHHSAPEGECVLARVSAHWNRTSFQTWYFAAIFYWITWLFLVAVVIEACFSITKRSDVNHVEPEVQEIEA